jgi:hypothetical protein
MVPIVLAEVALSVASFVAALGLIALVIRAQVRWFNRVAATDVLDDWQLQLELLSEEDRRKALESPPANVVAAMVALPSRGLRSSWNEGPY